MELMTTEKEGVKTHQPASISNYQKDPFRLLYEVVHENRIMEPNGLYSVENNLIVSKILTLATLAAEKKQSIPWDTL